MKRTETDRCWPAVDQASKDKQTLVLFLLGCALVVLPFLFPWGQPTLHDYTWTREPGAPHEWQVVSSAHDTSNSRLQGGSGPRDTPPPALALFFDQPLSLRTCRQEDLEMLPGVGPRMASAIIAVRERKGSLKGPADLLEIPGIGPATLQRIVPFVSFE